MLHRAIALVFLFCGCNDASFHQNRNLIKGAEFGSKTTTDLSSQIDSDETISDPSKAIPVGSLETNNKNTGSDAESDGVAISPQHVTGSYLHCAYILPATHDTSASTVACRIDDAEGARILPSSIAKKVTYSYQTPASVTTNVSMRQPAETDALYDVFFTVKDVSKAAADLSTSKLRVTAVLEETTSGAGTVTLSGPIAELAVAVEAPVTEWTKLCSGTVCEFRDNVLGLFWSPSNTTKILWSEAEQRCASYSSPLSPNKWRQPTVAELILANDHHMLTSTETQSMGIMDWSYWSRELDPNYVPGETWYYSIYFVASPGPSVGHAGDNFTLYSLCVRE